MVLNGAEVNLNLSSNKIGDSNNEAFFPHKLLLIIINLLQMVHQLI